MIEIGGVIQLEGHPPFVAVVINGVHMHCTVESLRKLLKMDDPFPTMDDGRMVLTLEPSGTLKTTITPGDGEKLLKAIRAMTPPASPKEVRMTSADGVTVTVGLVPHPSHSPYAGKPCLTISWEPRGKVTDRDELVARFPILSRVYHQERNGYNYGWNDSEFRALCGDLGIDPDAAK